MTSEYVIHESLHGWQVRTIDETGSTNDDLLAADEAGTVEPMTAFVAGHQTAGRGRLDRRWSAPAGSNLLVSMLFTEVPERPGRLTHLVGVAVVEGIERLLGEEREALGLKWPNDVLFDGRKLAGILAQRSPATGDVVVGVGLNVGWAPEGAASLASDLAITHDPLTVLDSILAGLSPARIAELAWVGFRDDDYRRRLLTLGARVRVELPADRSLSGTAVDVDADGRLVVAEIDGTRHALDVGDVVHVRPG